MSEEKKVSEDKKSCCCSDEQKTEDAGIPDSEKEKTEVQAEVCCCQHKQKHRSEKEYKDLMNRLKRIEGQVRGIQGMVEKDMYCTDILTGGGSQRSAEQF